MSSLPEAPVLIVGDHRDICQDLQDLLEHDGYLVQSVSTGWEALARVTQQHFHAMILEVGLPDQDGLSLLPLVKAADPLVPIVIVSAHGTGEQKTTALRLGAFAWLDKPYDRNELKALLRRAIGPAAVTIRPEQVEQRLLRVNIEHEALLELIPAMVWYKDAHNRIVRANRRAAESINKTVAEVEGQFTYDLYPEEAEKYYQDDLEVITSGQPKLGIVELYQTASGEKRWMQTDKVPYRDAQGIVMGVLVLAQDITERKEWENTLRDSENRLRAFSGQLEQLVQVRTEELTQSHDRLRGLATELNLAEQRERKRLAAELHDHLQQLSLVLGRLKLGKGKNSSRPSRRVHSSSAKPMAFWPRP